MTKEEKAIYDKEYRRRHKERIQAYKSEWYQTNKERLAKKERLYREANKEAIQQQRKSYRDKPESKAHKQEYDAIRRANQKDKLTKQQLAWRAANPERSRRNARNRFLKNRYGITLKQYEDMLQRQDGKCGLCKQTKDKYCVDHCHTTGKVRELLCYNCNNLLGMAGEDIHVLQLAVVYILRHTSWSKS